MDNAGTNISMYPGLAKVISKYITEAGTNHNTRIIALWSRIFSRNTCIGPFPTYLLNKAIMAIPVNVKPSPSHARYDPTSASWLMKDDPKSMEDRGNAILYNVAEASAYCS